MCVVDREFRKNVTDENEPLLQGFYYVFIAHCSPEWTLSFHVRCLCADKS